MSEQLIQKLLDIGGCSAETEWARGYDDGVNAAIDVVERYFDQPTLNENQQVLLNKLKINYLFHEESAEWAIYELLTDSDYKDGDIANDDLFVALDSFRNWVAEKESGENE